MAMLITGANGFAGRHALTFFLEHTTYQVVCVDLKNTDQLQSDRVRYIDCDLGSSDAVRAMIKETHPRKMLHLAGISSVRYSLEQPVATIQANVNQVLNLLEAIRVENVPTKVLMVSSGEVYGSPMNEEAFRTETHALNRHMR